MIVALDENDYNCAMGLIVQSLKDVSEYAIGLIGPISQMYNIPKWKEMVSDLKLL